MRCSRASPIGTAGKLIVELRLFGRTDTADPLAVFHRDGYGQVDTFTTSEEI